jgi:hypothetical protein
MKKHVILLLTLIFCAKVSLKAQIDKQEMLASTQRVVFVDSIVVDKQDFLSAYSLNPEVGSLLPYQQFFHTDEEPYSVVYLNQLGNKCIFAKNRKLQSADLIGQQWTQPSPLEGLGRYSHMNYPFMLADGVTFYFAAISPEGLGGLDIYMTRYDTETNSFVKAENIGMPFNSEANDYMYVVNEMDSIGFFATDRRQPDGKVCIYTFIPNSSRQVYDLDDTFNEDSVLSRAEIRSIADTWGDGSRRAAALQRLNRIRGTLTNTVKRKPEAEFCFVIDDRHVYTKYSDFRNSENRELYRQLLSLKNEHRQQMAELDKLRRYYARTVNEERQTLRNEIITAEQTCQKRLMDIRQKENQIRKTEIQKL